MLNTIIDNHQDQPFKFESASEMGSYTSMDQKQLLGILMNSKFIAITLVTIMSVIALGQLHSANAELQSGKSYIIYANGHDVGNNLEYTLELQLLIGSGSDKIPIYLVEGLIIHDNQDFVTSSNWKGTLLKNDGLIILSGNATTYDGTQLSMTLFGKFVNNTKDGANYKLMGRLTHEKQSMILTQTTEIVYVSSLTQKQIYKEMPHIFINQNKALQKLVVQPTKKTDAITVIVKQPERAYVHYAYGLTAKVYLQKENPNDNFDLHGGEVEGAHIIINILNENNVVKSFDGITDRFGYFSDLFIIPDNFTAGTYVVHVTAEKNGINDANDGILHVFYSPKGVGGKSIVPMTTVQATQQLIHLVESMTLDNGITNSLDAKLNAAISSFNSGNNNAAKNELNAFINQINAQAGKKISQSEANQLIASAQNIINSIH